MKVEERIRSQVEAKKLSEKNSEYAKVTVSRDPVTGNPGCT